MRIHLLAFATAAEALGRESTEIELPEGCRIGELRGLLGSRFPALAPLWGRLAIAVDGELVGDDHRLPDGAEVALLPPVSGGSGSEALPALTEAPLDLAAVAARVSSPGRGALVLFSGTVRNHHRGRAVEAITYTAYRPMAARRIEAIVAELEAEEPDLAVALVHRLGRLRPGEASVVIAATSPHRAAAYRASRTALERLKAEVPIWKHEHYADGSSAWREEESLLSAERPEPVGAARG
ncbi:MAG TPA: molybdenum cofactor biosynthesis protein MoaE [Thermoanaerobaculia bacterium]|nr:molybdenum cofactor biosynthesis protein MoaE [Thermoanaerobaculia bacterium]